MFVTIACRALVRTEPMRLAMRVKWFVPSSAVNSSITPIVSTHKIGVSMINQQRLNFWKRTHDHSILETYTCNDFLEIITRYGTWRVYGSNLSNFYITER